MLLQQQAKSCFIYFMTIILVNLEQISELGQYRTRREFPQESDVQAPKKGCYWLCYYTDPEDTWHGRKLVILIKPEAT